MKQIILVRHAKSSWKDDNLSDFERPLNKRGRLSAPFMAEVLQRNNIIPDKVYCSSAIRTMETCLLMSSVLDLDPKVEYKEEMYAAPASTHLNIINNTANKHNSLMLIAHNPGISNFLTLLTGSEEYMVTCAVAVIEFPFDDWGMISQDSGTLAHFDYPKKHEKFHVLLNES